MEEAERLTVRALEAIQNGDSVAAEGCLRTALHQVANKNASRPVNVFIRRAKNRAV